MRNLYFLFLCFLVSAVAFAQAPANDSCQYAMLLTPAASPLFDTIQLDGATSDMIGCGRTEDIWFKFEMPASGGIRIETQQVDLNYKPFIRLYEGTCGSFTSYACEGSCQYWNASNCGDELLLNDVSLAGDTLYIRMSKRFSHIGVDAAIRIIELNASDFPVNDACENAIDVSANLNGIASDTFTLKNSIVETNLAVCGTDEDVWVKFEVPSTGAFDISTNNFQGSYDQYFRVYTGGCAALVTYVCDGTCDYYSSTSNCGAHRIIKDPSLAGDTVWVRLANRFSSEARDSFSLSVDTIPFAEMYAYDSCGGAVDVSASLSLKSDTFTLKHSIAETELAICGNDEDVWVKFKVPVTGGFDISTNNYNGTYDQFFSIYTGGCASLAAYACEGTCDYYSTSNCGDHRIIKDPSLAGDTVWVRLANRFSSESRDSFGIRIDTMSYQDMQPYDSCGGAVDVTSSISLKSDTLTLKNALAETALTVCGNDEDVWVKFEVPATGAFEVTSNNFKGTYNQFFNLYTGGCAALQTYECDSNCNYFDGAKSCGEHIRVVDPSIAGDTVWLKIANRFSFDARDSFEIEVNAIESIDLEPNDDCADAIVLNVANGNCSVDTFDNINTTYSDVPTSTCGNYFGSDVWFKFEMPAGDDVFVDMSQVSATAKNFRITAFSGGCNSLSEEICNGSGNYPDLSIRNLGLAGDTIWLHVYITNESIEGDTFGICVKDTVLPPLRNEVGQYEKITDCQVISGSGWFDMVDTTGNLVMSIDPNGSYLGQTCFGINIEDSAASINTAIDTLGNMAYLGPRHWFINPVSNSGANVRLYYKERELKIWRDSLANRGISVGSSLEEFYQDSLRISKTDGESLTSPLGSNPIQINPTVTKVRDSIIIVEFTVTSFSNFITVFNPGNISAPVPVEWISFTGSKSNDVVTLNWATASELNCSHFEIQRSFDGREFKVIGIEEGQGTKTSVTNYVNSHRSTNANRAYYRLKQIDYDGSYEYSNVVVIASEKVVQVSPNPFSDKLEVTAGGEKIMKLEILDMYGRMVFQKAINDKSAAINLSTEIDHGMYILRVITETGVIEKKIVKK